MTRPLHGHSVPSQPGVCWPVLVVCSAAFVAVPAGLAGCSPRPWASALLPVVSVVLDQRVEEARRLDASARGVGARSLRVVLSFSGARARPSLPSPLDVSPALYALPCDDDDATCLLELAPDGSDAARASLGAP